MYIKVLGLGPSNKGRTQCKNSNVAPCNTLLHLVFYSDTYKYQSVKISDFGGFFGCLKNIVKLVLERAKL